MLTWHWLLGAWTALGLLWRVAGLLLVAAAERRPAGDGPRDRRTLTVFKALPGPLEAGERNRLRRCLTSFVADLDGESQLLIGCHELDRWFFEEVVEALRARFPTAALTLVTDPDPTRLAANPKVSWCRILAPHATGELWLWSDADIVAPPGTLESLRADIATPGVGIVTSPYVVSGGRDAPGLPDRLFVNAEFYPGVLLTDRIGLVRFAFGSGMLFEASRFAERVDWNELGGLLADDHELGRVLAPTRLGSMTLSTDPAAGGWGEALLHYLRWHKTVRWVQPAAYAAQLVVVPVVGWLAWALLQPSNRIAWLGLAAILLLETVAAILSCRLVGSAIPVRHWPLVPSWALLRGLTSVACWLPWPIVWRGRKWWGPRQPQPAQAPSAAGAEGEEG